MSKETGGPAFPAQLRGPNLTEWTERGMTLRDYFAAKAMQGLLAQSIGSAYTSDCKPGAEYAYRMADALLEARKK